MSSNNEEPAIIERHKGLYSVEKKNSECFEIKWDKISKSFRPKIVVDVVPVGVSRSKERTIEAVKDNLEQDVPKLQQILLKEMDFKTVAKVFQYLMGVEKSFKAEMTTVAPKTNHQKLMLAKGIVLIVRFKGY